MRLDALYDVVRIVIDFGGFWRSGSIFVWFLINCCRERKIGRWLESVIPRGREVRLRRSFHRCGAESRSYQTVVRSIRLDASIVRYAALKLGLVRSFRLDAWLGGWVS